ENVEMSEESCGKVEFFGGLELDLNKPVSPGSSSEEEQQSSSNVVETTVESTARKLEKTREPELIAVLDDDVSIEGEEETSNDKGKKIVPKKEQNSQESNEFLENLDMNVSPHFTRIDEEENKTSSDEEPSSSVEMKKLLDAVKRSSKQKTHTKNNTKSKRSSRVLRKRKQQPPADESEKFYTVEKIVKKRVNAQVNHSAIDILMIICRE